MAKLNAKDIAKIAANPYAGVASLLKDKEKRNKLIMIGVAGALVQLCLPAFLFLFVIGSFGGTASKGKQPYSPVSCEGEQESELTEGPSDDADNAPAASPSTVPAINTAAAPGLEEIPGTRQPKWTVEQVGIAWKIWNIGTQLGASERDVQIAIMIAMQESNLKNLAGGDRDSIGVYQQRPTAGWGPPEYIRNADYAITTFYKGPKYAKDAVSGLPSVSYQFNDNKGLLGSPRRLPSDAERANYRNNGNFQEVVQLIEREVQSSAHNAAPLVWERDAAAVLDVVSGKAKPEAAADNASVVPASQGACQPSTVQCMDQTIEIPEPVVSAQGWTVPVYGTVTSPFGQRQDPFNPGQTDTHTGVDIQAPACTPIRAAAAGTVTEAKCDAYRGGAALKPLPESACDEDKDGNGDPDSGDTTVGCGWSVHITHADNVATHYCHMYLKPLVKAGDTVQAGQIIGFVGSSGSSTGPHLHFEVHNPGPIDPAAFMKERGAELGKPDPNGQAPSIPPGKRDKCPNSGNTPTMKQVCEAAVAKFNIPHGIGCLREGDPQDHGKGMACDFMVSAGGNRPDAAGQKLGQDLAEWAIANTEMGVKYVIWEQKIWQVSAPHWRKMEDRGSITQNHYDHVHISVSR